MSYLNMDCVFHMIEFYALHKVLARHLLQLFEDENAVVPGILKRGIFTVGAKDNIDKNSTCTISKYHYHGTSISLL